MQLAAAHYQSAINQLSTLGSTRHTKPLTVESSAFGSYKSYMYMMKMQRAHLLRLVTMSTLVQGSTLLLKLTFVNI
jgi:hypothetical protein